MRIVAATHCNLDNMVTEGQFREDLLYRLNTVTLEVPPLRERPGELEPLAELFLAKAGADWEIPPKRLSERALAALRAYDWPGNVRQLRNVVERSSLVSRSATIDLKDLPAPLLAALDADRAKGSPPRDTAAHDSLVSKLDRYEKHVIEDALARTGGSRPATAKLLRIPLRTLYRRIRALGASER